MQDFSQTSGERIELKGGRTPNDFAQIVTVAKYELLNSVRSRRFLTLISLVLAFCLSASVVVEYYRPASMLSNSMSFAVDWLAYTMTFIIALPASFLGGDTISSEFQNKTGYSMIGNPIKRSSIFYGKMLAVFFGSLSMLCIYELTIVSNIAYNFGPGNLPFQFWESFGLLVLAELGAMGLVLLFDSLFKNGAVSIIFALLLLLYGLNLIENVYNRLIGTEPWFLLSYAAQTIMNVFIIPYPKTTVDSLSRITYIASLPEGIAIMLGYFVIGTAVSLLIFNKRDLS